MTGDGKDEKPRSLLDYSPEEQARFGMVRVTHEGRAVVVPMSIWEQFEPADRARHAGYAEQGTITDQATGQELTGPELDIVRRRLLAQTVLPVPEDGDEWFSKYREQGYVPTPTRMLIEGLWPWGTIPDARRQSEGREDDLRAQRAGRTGDAQGIA